jgi:hypothetical protein
VSLQSFQELLKDLARIPRMLFVVGGGACVSEMYADGKTEPKFSGQWAMMEAESWHFHLDLSLVKTAQFVEAEDHGAPVLYYVRLADEKDETILRCYFPNPYLDENDKRVAFQPYKQKVFEEVRDRHAGKEGVTFVKRLKS